MMVIMRLFFILFFLSILSCHSQEFSKVQVNKWRHNEIKVPVEAYEIDADAFKKQDDHTALLQEIINKYQVVVLPPKQLNINYHGISLRNNSQLYFQKKSVLKMIANDKGTYALIRIRGVNNVKVYNPQLIGDRDEHLASSGEWGMGIDIRSSNNIIIDNPYIKNMWGDGIYLGVQNSRKINENIFIKGGVIDYSRRNGVSITSGKNVRLNNVSIYNTYGTDPMAAIDIEPNKNSVIVSEVVLDSVKTINNGFSGLTIALSHLRYTKHKFSNITIKNHYDRGSLHALRIGPVSTPQATGDIQILNSNWADNISDPFIFSDISKTSIEISIINSFLNNTPVNKDVAVMNVKGKVNSKLKKNFQFK